MKKIAILASHNGSGFEAIYRAIENGTLNAEVCLVISNNSNANVLNKAKKFNVDFAVVNKSLFENPDEKIFELLKEKGCQYVFLSGYMKKLSPLLTENFSIINSHPSLLPKFGGTGMYGRFVHEAVILANETISGVTIHEVDKNYDEGKIILQTSLEIFENESVDSLEERIKELEKVTIIEALQKCLN
ncbi:MAG: phosphoribosylglycinamide formyltransferase [Campylobacterales bacterium]|nr:phosphoribosylglycinamide formyltransferase [Campylobacterales bacterium]